MKYHSSHLPIFPAINSHSEHWLDHAVETLLRYQRHYRTRRQLAKLDADQLRDVGISIEKAQGESRKYFWQE